MDFVTTSIKKLDSCRFSCKPLVIHERDTEGHLQPYERIFEAAVNSILKFHENCQSVHGAMISFRERFQDSTRGSLNLIKATVVELENTSSFR
jgi:hypothetical protein